MTARKSERMMNLVICLLVARTFIPKDRIRTAVDGYADLSDDAFDRMFDRDKEELRVLGVPIEVGPVQKGFEDETGYRIRRALFELPEITLEADEAAVLGLAARVWQHARLASATTQGLRKLRAGGVDVDETALAIIEPQLAADDPALEPIMDAVMLRQPVRFQHRRPGASDALMRHLQPWGIVSWHGHWYVVGYDTDRQAERMFRLSRISGSVQPDGPADSYRPPDDLDLRTLTESLAPTNPHDAALIRVRSGAGDLLRRRATAARQIDDTWTQLTLPYASGESLVDELLSYGDDVIVVAPSEVREGVIGRLESIVTSLGARP